VCRPCCGRYDPSVLEFGFKLDCLVYTSTADHIYKQFRLAQNQICVEPSGRNYCARRGVRVLYPPRTNKCDHGPTYHSRWPRPKWYTVAYSYWGKLIGSETVHCRLCNYVRLNARWSVWCMFQSLISSCKSQFPEAYQQSKRASEDRVTAVSVLQLVFHHMSVTINYCAQCSITCR
jgi:hypothetical protein